MKYSTASATRTTSAEIRKPCTIGAAPDFFISAKLVLSPTAASAVTMRNLLSDFFGARQHGLPTLRVADFTCDMELLYEAQGAAEALLALDPRLEGHPALHARGRELFDLNAEALN